MAVLILIGAMSSLDFARMKRCPSSLDFVHLHPCTFVYDQTEPQTKPYPLDMWKYAPRSTVDRVHPWAHQLAPWAPRATDGRAPRGGHTARPEAATSARPAGGGARAPMVAGGGPTKEVAGVEGGGGAARVDGDGGVPAVGELGEPVDGVGGSAAKPEETTPRRGTVPTSG
ncbi:pr1-like protein [Oryza sativa Japonica Group]|uniref:Pr1-like protein n=1 Tax=Oryza sativa subsp. japonica TaxID=39947 RepID=Q5ZD00_ORYSJ|nr:pr1-like protein [Oryza sativa Japonica Group]